MKIIAFAGGDNLIVQCSKNELANVAGYDGVYYYRCAEQPEFGIGLDVQVASIFRRLQELRRNQANVRDAQTKLRAVADLLDPVVVAVEAADEVQP